ncbi:MAG: hypothetical protein ACJ74Y_11945 [Bryobacteraceae bacterium]
MRRTLFLTLVFALIAFGDTFKLFLKDGNFHAVREYQIQGDRVRYYSTERGDWEEIPKDLVDLAKTEAQRKQKQEAITKETRAQDEEEQAERAQRREIESIPVDSGAYIRENDRIRALSAADYQILTDKKRKALQVLSPIPLVPGKATVVIKGERSSFGIKETRPEFYLRLAKEEKFGIIRLTPNAKKNFRIVENVSIVPVSRESLEIRKQIETFEMQMKGNLYKVWPEKPLEPGEYALMEFSDDENAAKDEIALLIWDFAIE